MNDWVQNRPFPLHVHLADWRIQSDGNRERQEAVSPVVHLHVHSPSVNLPFVGERYKLRPTVLNLKNENS